MKPLFFISLFVTLASCNIPLPTANYSVIPLPNEIISDTIGKPFIFNNQTVIVYPYQNEKLKKTAELAAEYFEQSCGFKIVITPEYTSTNAIILSTGLNHESDDAYTITVDSSLISICGKTEKGVFYGIQTIRKAMPANVKIRKVIFPAVQINDSPRFAHRGLMLDVARSFSSIEFIKKTLDLLALHNINVFHWHLTDDQGWRIEIKKYPKLTSIGSIRAQTLVGRYGSNEYDGKPVGGFYTQEEIKEVIKYAAERFIDVIPEIDIPGHMSAALAAYPEFGCTGGPYKVQETWGVFDEVLCVGNEKTMQFLEDIFIEVINLFPSQYIHIGGDECPKTLWKKCPKCQKKIKELGLKTNRKHTAEEYLQSYCTKRIEKLLNKHNRRLIGWDEILEGGISSSAVVMSWRGIVGGIDAAKLGNQVIMSPTTYCYFDYAQTTDLSTEPVLIGGFVDVQKVYQAQVIPEILTPEQQKLIFGFQANLWTEYLYTDSLREYQLLPRLAALSEGQWTKDNNRDYLDFEKRLPALLAFYDRDGYNYAKHIFDVSITDEPDTIKNQMQITLKTIGKGKIFYTVDGSVPSSQSIPYTTPFIIEESTTLKCIAIHDAYISQQKQLDINVNKATFKPITLLYPPHPSYASIGAQNLNDGIIGNDVFGSGRWLGFMETPMVAIIDLKSSTSVGNVTLRTLLTTWDRIVEPEKITIETSPDGKTYTKVKEKKIEQVNADVKKVTQHSVNFDNIQTRFIKVSVYPAKLPLWHSAKDEKGWCFISEIEVD